MTRAERAVLDRWLTKQGTSGVDRQDRRGRIIADCRYNKESVIIVLVFSLPPVQSRGLSVLLSGPMRRCT